MPDYPTEVIATDARAGRSVSKKLVAYFSATGTTKAAAQEIAQVLLADTYEIKPKVPYTEADLDWRDENSRSYVEMHDQKFRPEIVTNPVDIQSYDFILLGYPIWWGVAPTAVNTFLEANDFRGKTIIPFATAGGSDIGNFRSYLGRSFPEIVETEKEAIMYWLCNDGAIVTGEQARLSPVEWAKTQDPLWQA